MGADVEAAVGPEDLTLPVRGAETDWGRWVDKGGGGLVGGACIDAVSLMFTLQEKKQRH